MTLSETCGRTERQPPHHLETNPFVDPTDHTTKACWTQSGWNLPPRGVDHGPAALQDPAPAHDSATLVAAARTQIVGPQETRSSLGPRRRSWTETGAHEPRRTIIGSERPNHERSSLRKRLPWGLSHEQASTESRPRVGPACNPGTTDPLQPDKSLKKVALEGQRRATEERKQERAGTRSNCEVTYETGRTKLRNRQPAMGISATAVLEPTWRSPNRWKNSSATADAAQRVRLPGSRGSRRPTNSKEGPGPDPRGIGAGQAIRGFSGSPSLGPLFRFT
jgi:hypothetical protein